MSTKNKNRIPRYQRTPSKPTSPKIRPRNEAQSNFLQCMAENDIILVAGDAGTGKTFLSVGCAVELFNKGQIKQIVVTRPVVEAGNSLGALPGTSDDKMTPYITPIMQELGYFVPKESLTRPPIEIAPINYMRGRTFKDSFIIVDEAQNLLEEQLKMVLTRFGEGSKMIINGDFSQSDLPHKVRGAFESYWNKLKGVEGIGTFKFSPNDIVRHPILTRILNRLKEYT